jgi:hypothetical protein
VQPNHVWVRRSLIDNHRCSTQKAGGYVPTLTSVSDDRNRLLVVSRQHPDHDRAPLRLKLDAVADPELKHFGMRPHLMKEPQAFNDPIVQVDQFGFGEPVDVDLHVTSQRD